MECGLPLLLEQSVANVTTGAKLASRGKRQPLSLTPVQDDAPPITGLAAKHPHLIDEERRLVTILFADVVGFTSFSEQRDPEIVRRVMYTYFEGLAKEIRRFDGTIEKFIGDAIMAIFGAPTAHEDDPQRSINAALEMQAAIAEINRALLDSDGLTLQMRIGIMTGKVVGGIRSFEQSGAYTVTGDVVNTAARLQAAAGPGEILVGELTYQMSGTQFLFEPVPPLTVKGKITPVTAYLVRGRCSVSSAAPSLAVTPLVGRQSELHLLQEYMQRVIVGDGRLIAIVGEAGIGKSRLVLELRSRNEQPADAPSPDVAATSPGLASSWHWVTNMSFLATTQFGALTVLVRSLLGLEDSWDKASGHQQLRTNLKHILGEHVPEAQFDSCLAPLGELLSVTDPSRTPEKFDAKVQRRMLLASLRSLVAAKAARQPLTIVLDDGQWIDQASMEVMDDLMQLVPEHPMLILITHRPGWQHKWSGKGFYHQINLGSLTVEESHAFYTLVGADLELPDDFIEQLVGKTGGNPLFIEEVVHAIRKDERRGLEDKHAKWQAPTAMPATIEGILAARIDSLEPHLRRILQIAAVIGQIFAERLLTAVGEASAPLRPHLERLIQLEFIAEHHSGLVADVEYRFQHGLIQEVSYHQLLITQRQALHLRTAQCLEELYAAQLSEHSELLAYHFSRSLDKERTIFYLRLAGDHAMRLYAHEAAYHHYQQALALCEDSLAPSADERKAELCEYLGEVCDLLGKGEKARSYYEQSLALLARQETDASVVAQLHRRIGETWLKQGEFSQALNCYACAEKLLEGREPGTSWAQVRLALAQVCFRRGMLDQTHAHCEEALPVFLTHARYKEAGDVYNLLAGVELRQSHVDTAIAQLFQSVVMRERSRDLPGKASCYSNLGVIYASKGEPGKAIAFYKQGLDLFEKTGDLYAASTIYCNLGMAYALTSEFHLALQSLEQWIRLADTIGFRLILAEAYCQLARVCRITGQWQQVIGYLSRSRAIAQQSQAKDTLIAINIEHGHFLFEQHQRVAAAEYFTAYLTSAEETDEQVQVVDCCNHLALLALANNDRKQVTQWLERSTKLLGALSSPRCLGEHSLVQARLDLVAGEYERAAAHLERAQQISRESGNLLLLAQCQRWLGNLQSARQEWSAAQGAFLESQTLLRRIGALPELGRVISDYVVLLHRVAQEEPSRLRDLPQVQAVLDDARSILSQVGMEEELDAVLASK
jgi:class 3 adenylate cyclase/tetratricopeptide (TPR) repeat protein